MSKNEYINLETRKEEIEKILEILKSYKDGILFNRGFAVEKRLPKGKILFLGINPSSPIENAHREDFYPINEDELLNGEAKNFFKKAIEISKETFQGETDSFAHHDLFFIRETNQQVIKTLFSNKQYAEFIDKSLDFSAKIIQEAEPIMIVACNAFVRDIFFERNFLGFNPATDTNPSLWDEELGVDFILLNDRKVPLLFTGMLGSTGVIDNGSFYELKWHIRHILKGIGSL